LGYRCAVNAENPYKPPMAPVKDAPPPPRSPILAIVAGVAVDIGGTMAASIVLGIVYAVTLAGQGMGAEEVGKALTEVEPGSGFYLVGAAVGFGFSVLGGYVCARIARRGERRLAALQALLVVAVGLLMGDSPDSPLDALLFLATLAAVMLGGELGRRRNARDAGAASAA
jgi:hypothetical protein